MGERRSGTREKIQAVALELFAEHGYEKTSLREIAERLDVTKAALYYHFNTKEDIVVSLFDSLLADMDETIAWLGEQPHTLETRRELVERYARLTRQWPPGMRRLIQDSKATMRELAVAEKLHARLQTMIRMLTPPDASPLIRLKSTMALMSINAATFVLQDTGTALEERHAAGLTLALELVSDTTCDAPSGRPADDARAVQVQA
ncbi:TetR/AcrR family transcriptional regulator [Actinomadura sp. DC4]|uniref:TetR/AcrR family transcriptional regulator n=1 Tax=Actinomadura sp. DC4 TaxID=3055069 RepID=UPI0025B277E0|nr:TetR/AcrR family transcriptional regulator [Actinomadura sp. DC4]MDN3358657.1 helix-turn-helix domain-containing protein [Actinomadura sp. DC4]